MHGRLGGLDDQRVHNLDRSRYDAGRDDVGDRAAGLAGRTVGGQQYVHGLGQRHQFDDDLGDNAQRAFRADEGAEHVVPGGHAGAVAEPG